VPLSHRDLDSFLGYRWISDNGRVGRDVAERTLPTVVPSFERCVLTRPRAVWPQPSRSPGRIPRTDRNITSRGPPSDSPRFLNQLFCEATAPQKHPRQIVCLHGSAGGADVHAVFKQRRSMPPTLLTGHCARTEPTRVLFLFGDCEAFSRNPHENRAPCALSVHGARR